MIEMMTKEQYDRHNSLEIIEERELLGQDFKIYGDKENPLFLAKDVAEWIDYSKTSQGYYNTSKMLMVIDEDEKVTITNSNSGGSKVYLTEDGLYEVLMQSRKPIAKQFKKEVKKILKEIRRTGRFEGAAPKTTEEIMIWQLQEQQKIKQQLNEVNNHVLIAKNEVEKLEEEFKTYKDEDTLRVVECEELSDLVKGVGVRLLNGKNSKAYKDKGLRIRVYKSIWAELKQQFEVNRYKQIKRKYFENAKEIVVGFRLPFLLENEIKVTNNQISF